MTRAALDAADHIVQMVSALHKPGNAARYCASTSAEWLLPCRLQRGFLEDAAHCASTVTGELGSMHKSFELIGRLTKEMAETEHKFTGEGDTDSSSRRQRDAAQPGATPGPAGTSAPQRVM